MREIPPNENRVCTSKIIDFYTNFMPIIIKAHKVDK